MNNWNKTYVVVSSTDRSLLNQLLSKIKAISSFGSFNYKNLVKALGLNPSLHIGNACGEKVKQEHDGVIKWVERNQGIPPLEVYAAIAKALKGIKITYCGVDDNDIPFITNDVDNLYFPERFVLVDLTQNKVLDKFPTIEELSDFISIRYGVDIQSQYDIKAFNDRFEDVRIAVIKEKKTQYYY